MHNLYKHSLQSNECRAPFKLSILLHPFQVKGIITFVTETNIYFIEIKSVGHILDTLLDLQPQIKQIIENAKSYAFNEHLTF